MSDIEDSKILSEYSKRDKWLRELFSLSSKISSSPFFRAALTEIESNGDRIHPGSAFDDVDSQSNICFLKCHNLGFYGNAFIRESPKRIIFLCEETFDYHLKNGEYQDALNIITHEMIHWIDLQRKFDFLEPAQLFCSELRARMLSGQCPDYYTGRNTLFKKLFNNADQCSLDGALKSMKTVNEDYSSWKPSEELLNKCILDVYPWKERPKTIQHAKQLLIKKYKLSEAQPPE